MKSVRKLTFGATSAALKPPLKGALVIIKRSDTELDAVQVDQLSVLLLQSGNNIVQL